MLKEIDVIDGRDLHTNIKSVPRKPGVYAWYPRLSLDETSAVAFRTSMSIQLDAGGTLPKLRGHIGQYAADLTPGTTTLTSKKSAISHQVAASSTHRPRFAYAFLATSIFQPPLYVGKANNLRTRIRSHRDGRSDFSQEMIARNLMPNELVVAYVVLEKLPPKCNELLEYVLTAISAPPFVKRKG